jgi:hypothetical protein
LLIAYGENAQVPVSHGGHTKPNNVHAIFPLKHQKEIKYEDTVALSEVAYTFKLSNDNC